eukprot:jgi/Galph1/2863/GphlegSOOS_G1497.1
MSQVSRTGRTFENSRDDAFLWANSPFYRVVKTLLPRDIQSSSENWSPTADLIEKEDAFLLKVEVPGLSKENIKVDLNGDILTVSGERIHEHETEKGMVYHNMERFYGTFERSVRLPKQIDRNSVKASYKDGILTITVPKERVEKSEYQKIEVTSE